MNIDCPTCGKPITVPEQHYNQTVNCPHCSQSLFFEKPEEQPEADVSGDKVSFEGSFADLLNLSEEISKDFDLPPEEAAKLVANVTNIVFSDRQGNERQRIREILDDIPYLSSPDAIAAVEKKAKGLDLTPDELLSIGKFSEAKATMLKEIIKDKSLSDLEVAAQKEIIDSTFHLINPDAFLAHALEEDPDAHFASLKELPSQAFIARIKKTRLKNINKN